MIKQKVFNNVEVIMIEADSGIKIYADIGKLRLKSGTFSTRKDAEEAAAFLDGVITECIENGVLGDLRQGELF